MSSPKLEYLDYIPIHSPHSTRHHSSDHDGRGVYDHANCGSDVQRVHHVYRGAHLYAHRYDVYSDVVLRLLP
jgi:hypothetical protein